MERDTRGIIRYIHHYVRNLKEDNPLLPEKLRQIGNKFTHFRLSWDGEYFDFSHDMGIFHPIEGKSSLLDKSLDFRVTIKPYTMSEFIELAKNASWFIAFSLPEALQFTPLLNMDCTTVTNQDIDIFDTVKVFKYKDYNQLIVDLEGESYVTTRSSQNLIATIDKKFELTPKAVQTLPLLKQYENYFYEADCLGTTLHEHLTKHMEILWYLSNKKQLKNNTFQIP